MIEIRTKPDLQRWTEGVWQNIGGQVILTVQGTSLEGADLRGIKLDSADLRQANLRRADFSGASLVGTDLSGADLTAACFRQAVMLGTDLRSAVLDHVDLGEALFAGAQLEGADLRLTQLERAKLGGCYFDETTRWPAGFDPWDHRAGPSAELVRRVQEWMSSGATPEEYAGRHGHRILIFGAVRHQFRDPEMTRWMRRLGEILTDPELLGECHQKFLTTAELEKVRRVEERRLRNPARKQ